MKVAAASNEKNGAATQQLSAPNQNHFRVFVDGAGMGPFGTGSGYAWIYESKKKRLVKRIDGLTNNEAEYRALLSALKHLPEGAEAEVFSDSLLICAQYAGRYAVNKPELQALLSRVREVVRDRRLKVTLTWVPRERNLAGKLLER